MRLRKKVRRYSQLILRVSNWFGYLLFKIGSRPRFGFKLRSGLNIEVTRKMIPPFKESFFDNVYLKELPKAIKEEQQPIIIDVGANVGFFSLNMFTQFEDARVYAFEPIPFNFQQLSKYKDLYPQYEWKIYNEAVANHEEGFVLYSVTVNGFTTMASLEKSEGKVEEMFVSTTKLESLMEKEGIDSITLLKLDCEGSEYPILYDLSTEVLSRIKNLSIETHPSKMVGNNHNELVSYLNNKNWSTKDQMNDDGTGYIWAWKD